MNGWPSQKSNTDLDLRAYYSVRHELTVQDGLLFKDCRIVVPIRLRKDIISSIHRSHQGIQGCIRIAKDTVYWPLMNQQIADYVSQCSICNTHRPDQCKEPMLPHDVPGRPWAKKNRCCPMMSLGGHGLRLAPTCSNCVVNITWSWLTTIQISSS